MPTCVRRFACASAAQLKTAPGVDRGTSVRFGAGYGLYRGSTASASNLILATHFAAFLGGISSGPMLRRERVIRQGLVDLYPRELRSRRLSHVRHWPLLAQQGPQGSGFPRRQLGKDLLPFIIGRAHQRSRRGERLAERLLRNCRPIFARSILSASCCPRDAISSSPCSPTLSCRDRD